MNTGSSIKRNDALKISLLTAALSLRFLIPFSPVQASEVIVIKDSEIKPYREAIDGFKSVCGCSVRELGLADLDALEQAIKARPDAVVAVGTRAFRKTKAIKDLPVIYTMVMPSETAGRNGRNVSGVSMNIPPETYLAAMTRLFPTAKRVGLLYNPEHTGFFVKKAIAAAAERGVTLVVKTMSEPRQAPALLDELRGRIEVFWMLPDATLASSEAIDYLMLFSFHNHIPVFSFSEKYVEKGAVAALKIDPKDMGTQAGEMFRQILQGGKSPLRAFARTSRLVVNRKVGSKLGVRINDELLRNAENVE